MSGRDWLSLSEIARRWSEETGESAHALERDLEAWFSEFVERPASQQPGSPDRPGDTTNLLMGLLGGRHLQRETLALYCEERGLPEPRFWVVDEGGLASDPEPVSDPEPEIDRSAADEPAATPGPAGHGETWPDPDLLGPVPGAKPPEVTAWYPAPFPARGGPIGPKAVRLAGGLALGLALLAVGYGLGQGGGEAPRTGLQAAGAAGGPADGSAALEAAALRAELGRARQRIAELERDALTASAEAKAAKAEATGLAGQLENARRQEAERLERLRAEAVGNRRELAAARDLIARLAAARPAPESAAQGSSEEPVPARRAPATARHETGAPAEAIDADSLVADPGRFDARRVVVTGSLMHLLQHYRLQSESGGRTLVVDVDGLHRDQYDRLRHAIAGAGLIGSVRAQISGTVERGSAKTFRLVASDLKLVE